MALLGNREREIGILHNPTLWFLVQRSMTALYQDSLLGSFLMSCHVFGVLGRTGSSTAKEADEQIGGRVAAHVTGQN